jgi:hypothetical protein
MNLAVQAELILTTFVFPQACMKDNVSALLARVDQASAVAPQGIFT